MIAQQHWFERGVLRLADAGRYDEVAVLVLQVLDPSGDQTNVGAAHRIVTTLLRRGHTEQLWPRLAAAMLEGSSPLLAWQLANDQILDHIDSNVVLAWVNDDPRRARTVAALTNPHAATLDEVTRQLLIRFGSEGEVARKLASRARSTPGMVLSGFERRQRDHARAWAEDSEPAIRTWALLLAESFGQDVEENEARTAFRRKYG